MERTIFIVDDNETNLVDARKALIDYYQVMTLPSASKMFSLLEKVIPDLILLDIKMPEIDGFEALSRLKSASAYADIPIIFLTNISDVTVEARGFQLGVVDFITKPFSSPVLLNRIKTHLDIDILIRERTAEIEQQKERLEHLKNSIVHVVADMVEKRDQETGGHIERTTAYIRILLDAMLDNGIYTEELRDLDIDLFVSSARLHDVGKIAISDNILNKPGKLTAEEKEIMKTHAMEGVLILDRIISRTVTADHLPNFTLHHEYRYPSQAKHYAAESEAAEKGNAYEETAVAPEVEKTFLEYAKLFAGYHHERWDGNGYPYGLSGMDIPFQGRLMAFADVYDALISVRPYKEAFTHEEAVRIIMENSGTQFDPLIAEVFYNVKDQFKAVSFRY